MFKIQNFSIPTSSDYHIPIQFVKAEKATQTILILPALGIAVRFYIPLAEELVKQGFNVVLLEQRGHGESLMRASRKNNYGFKEYLIEDIPAVLNWIDSHLRHTEVILFGHSLGGHLATCFAALNPNQVNKIILAACSTPWFEAYTGKIHWQLQILYRLIPIVNFIFGYYPGKLIGFGGKEARNLMNDWRHLVKNNTYFVKGLNADIESKISKFQGTVLSLSFDADTIAPYKGIKAVNDKYKSAILEHHLIKSKKIGFSADHFKWAKKPKEVVSHIKSWLFKYA